MRFPATCGYWRTSTMDLDKGQPGEMSTQEQMLAVDETDTALEQPVDERQARLAAVGGIHFSAPFIKRPVATFLLSGALILAGCVAYVLLPVSSLPQVE